MRTKLKPNIFLPIEVKPREFAAKVLIGAEAATRGARAYIGSKPGVNIASSRLNGGAYLYKDMTLVSLMLKIKERGHYLVILDEEMGPADDEIELTYRARFSENNIPYVDKILLLSNDQLEPLKKCSPKFMPITVVTGWARTDLWRDELRLIYSKKVKNIHNRFKEFVLIASDFGVTSQEALNEFVAHINRLPISQEDKDLAIERWQQMFKSFKEFINVVKSILSNSSIRLPHLIIRPHPGDDHEGWLKEFEGYNNIDIIYEGDISAWLDASLGMIHRGCTTAIEAAFRNKPVAYYQGSIDFVRDALPRQVSKILHDEFELLSFIQNIKEESVPLDLTDIINKKIFFPKNFSYQLIVDELLKFELKLTKPAKFTLGEKIKSLYLNEIRERFVRKSSKWNLNVAPNSQKRPGGFKAHEAKQILSNFKHFENLKVSQIYKDLILIEQ